MSHAPRCFAMK